MSYALSYRRLFRVDVLHDYFLNSGDVSFELLAPDLQELLTNNYAFNSFLRIIPTEKTKEVMGNQKMMLRADNVGFEVIVNTLPAPGTPVSYEPFIPIGDELELTFLVKTGDPYFENYTDLTIKKDETFLFSNVAPEDVSPFDEIPLKDVGSPDITNDYRMSEEVTAELVKDLTNLERIGLFGLIKIRMHGDDADRNITDGTNKVFAAAKHFELGFKNRSMVWRYNYGGTAFYAETNEALPLTKNGYIAIDPSANLTVMNPDPDSDFDPEKYHYPGPDVANVIKTTPTNYQSVIYI